jgi:hypothetical protein
MHPYNHLLSHREANEKFQQELREAFPNHTTTVPVSPNTPPTVNPNTPTASPNTPPTVNPNTPTATPRNDDNCRRCLQQLLKELADRLPDLRENDGRPKFAVWLLHGHYNLQPGEMMVSSDDSSSDDPLRVVMQPTRDSSESIVPERWDNTGEIVLEHRRLRDPPSPAERSEASEAFKRFLDGFKEVMKNNKITMLGIRTGPDPEEWERLIKGYIFLETTGHGNRRHFITPKIPNSDIPFLTETAWVPCPDLWNLAANTFSPFSIDGCSHNCSQQTHGVKLGND